MNEIDFQFMRWLRDTGKIQREILAVDTLLALIVTEEALANVPHTTAKHLKNIKNMIEEILKRTEL